MTKIVLASGNVGKLTEIRSLLAPLHIDVVAQNALGVPSAEEPAATFVENAILKARNAATHTSLPALADDSGLAVDYLGGAPGVHSARYAGKHGDDAANNAKLLRELEGVQEADRGAQFHCCVVYLRSANDPAPLICHGIWPGRILHQPQGDNGFGYDPLFWVPDEQASSAELAAERKNAISHRGQAMAQLIKRLHNEVFHDPQ